MCSRISMFLCNGKTKSKWCCYNPTTHLTYDDTIVCPLSLLFTIIDSQFYDNEASHDICSYLLWRDYLKSIRSTIQENLEYEEQSCWQIDGCSNYDIGMYFVQIRKCILRIFCTIQMLKRIGKRSSREKKVWINISI